MAKALRSAWFWGLALALAVGAVFRLSWPADMEYKLDEAWVYQLARDFMHEGRFVWLGMPASQGQRIPGLSVWGFYALGAAFGVEEPTGLARGVQVLSLLAVGGLIVFARRCVPPGEREWWLWAAALACVNPILVLFHRKIWPPCLLPAGLVALVVCWWLRRRRGGAFGWGALAALLFQVHVGMLFHAAALTAYTFLYDRRGVAWRWWLAGSLVGAVPAVPWLWYMGTTHDHAPAEQHLLRRLVEFKFWGHWTTEPLGLGLGYFFGPDTTDVLAWPRLGGQATWGTLVLEVVVVALGVSLLLAAARRCWRDRPPLGTLLGAGNCQTDLLLHAVMWGFGLVLTATCMRFYRHYMLLAFPFPLLWLARLALPLHATPRQRRLGRATLVAICTASALITAATLGWVHDNGGSEFGGYGRTYARKVASGQLPPVPPLASR
jgi:hypothetical protein